MHMCSHWGFLVTDYENTVLQNYFIRDENSHVSEFDIFIAWNSEKTHAKELCSIVTVCVCIDNMKLEYKMHCNMWVNKVSQSDRSLHKKDPWTNTVTVHIIQALLELRHISHYPLQIIWEGNMVEGMVQWIQTMENNKIMIRNERGEYVGIELKTKTVVGLPKNHAL